jgi:hypothetical protein
LRITPDSSSNPLPAAMTHEQNELLQFSSAVYLNRYSTVSSASFGLRRACHTNRTTVLDSILLLLKSSRRCFLHRFSIYKPCLLSTGSCGRC